MSKRNRNACTWPHCTAPKDKHRNCGLCTEHSQRWVQSAAFDAVGADPNVRAALAFGETFFKKEVAKHRRRWVKAEAKKEEM